MEALALSTEVLDWAAGRIGDTLDGLARSIAKRKTTQEDILAGRLTVRQIEKVAQRTRVPFGFLFLDHPPQLEVPTLPDLRRTTNPDPLSNEFYEVLADVEQKHAWFIEYLRAHEADPVPFVGKYSLAKNPGAREIAQDIAATLGLGDRDRSSSGEPSAYFSAIATKAESAGVIVMKNGVVRSNSRRALSEREFRGFAVANDLAPLVFVNGQDAQVAAVFTLAHELAHIWLGVSGVSDIDHGNSRDIEVLCNAVAASLLVPEDAFRAQWEISESIPGIAKHFRVSQVVIARRALDFRLIDQAAYDAVVAASGRRRGGGGDGLRNAMVRNSKRLTTALVTSAMNGETLIRDAASMLNVSPATVIKLARTGGE